MNLSALQYARPIRKNLLALGTMMLLISSIPALGQVPGPQSELPRAPSAKAESYSSQQSKTSLAGTDQTSSIESGRETLTEQADYFVPMTNRERWDHYAYSLVEPQAYYIRLFRPASTRPAIGLTNGARAWKVTDMCALSNRNGSGSWITIWLAGGPLHLRCEGCG